MQALNNNIGCQMFKEQKSGVILTSTEPNISRMLFSIKDKKKYAAYLMALMLNYQYADKD